jgi:hypothetical protein
MSDTANSATGIHGAAQSFEALLAGGNPDLGSPELAEAAPEAPALEKAEAFDDSHEGEETAAVSEEAEAVPEEEVAAESDEGSEEAEPEVQLVTVTVNGKTEQIPLEEAIKGYQRQADYSRKTQALSEERKTLESEKQAVLEERSQYAQLLTALQQQLQAAAPQEPDWQKLYETDPMEWVRQREVWRERQERMTAAQFEAQRIQTLQAQEQQAQLAKMVQEGRQKLVELVPAWKDAKKWEADRVGLLDYGQQLGFSADELNATYDPRAVVALYKAMQYDALMAKRPQAAPPRVKTAPAGSASSAPRPQSDTTKAKQRLAKTGKVADAAALFENFID